MATPWPQLLQQVPNLNNQQSPFSYSVTPEGVIVGYWDVAKIQMLGLTGASSFSKEYRIDVRPTGDGEYEYVETGTESSGSVGQSGGGFQKEFFKGKSTQKSFGFQAGLGGTSHGEPTNAASWSFDTDAIKKPLFDFLEHFGWQAKKGFFGRLFS
ncbi:hypothetical protein [Pseudactinotalea terrae]|uniref:hypothetical protein n=1 Tax=Pseudactinotalea terrae TaxID=1743262 RepID=UPI0012E2173B|nr:hypothetical protein [Pseudactinotalea terrae]